MNFLFFFSSGFVSSMLQIHLKDYGLSQAFISLFFSLQSAVYLTLCLTLGYMLKGFDERYSMIIGSLLLGLAYLFFGPWTVIFPDSLVLIILSLPLFGAGQCFTYSKI
jgi:nitrate/nitrite transporter NarK